MNHVLFGLHSGTIKQINGVLSEANEKQFKQNWHYSYLICSYAYAANQLVPQLCGTESSYSPFTHK